MTESRRVFQFPLTEEGTGLLTSEEQRAIFLAGSLKVMKKAQASGWLEEMAQQYRINLEKGHPLPGIFNALAEVVTDKPDIDEAERKLSLKELEDLKKLGATAAIRSIEGPYGINLAITGLGEFQFYVYDKVIGVPDVELVTAPYLP